MQVSNFEQGECSSRLDRGSVLRAARRHGIDLSGCKDVVAGTSVLGLRTSILSLDSLTRGASTLGSSELVDAVCGILATLGVDVVGCGGQAVEDVGDTVCEGCNNAASDAGDDGLNFAGEFALLEELASGSEDVVDIAADVAGLVVEESGERLEETATDNIVGRRGG